MRLQRGDQCGRKTLSSKISKGRSINNAADTVKGNVDLRGNLEVGGPEDITETEIPVGPARAQDGNEEVTGSTSRG